LVAGWLPRRWSRDVLIGGAAATFMERT